VVDIYAQYEQDLHCRAQHGPSGAVLVTDAPVDNQGLGASFSPTDLVATGLGTCMLTVLGILAKKRGFQLEGTRVPSSRKPPFLTKIPSTVNMQVPRPVATRSVGENETPNP